MKAKRLHLCTIAIALGLVAIPAMAADKPVRTYHISGTVVSALSGDPIPGAEIAIGISQNPDVLAAISTTSDGHFDFPSVAAGKYWLVAEGRNFSRQGYQQHDNYFTGIAVGPDLVTTGLVFRVTPNASVGGTIADDAGDPVNDARVLLFRSGLEEGRRTTSLRSQTTSDDLGKYHFSHLEPGTYLIAVSGRPWYAQYVTMNSPGGAGTAAQERSPLDVTFPLTYYSGTTDGDRATPVELRGGDKITADLQLTAVPALHLVVHGISDNQSNSSDNSQGVSLSGVSISMVQQVFGTAVPPVGSQVSASAEGQYEVSGIAPGQYTAVLQSYGAGASTRQRNIDLSQDLEIGAAETWPSLHISGIATLDNQPFGKGGGVLRFTNRDSGDALQTVIDSKGAFTVTDENVAAGRYDIALFNVPDTAVKSITAEGAKVAGTSIEVGPGSAAHLSVALARGLTQIDGVVNRQGKRFSGAMVVLVPKDMENNIGLLRRDQSDSDGTFSLRDVLPGQYTLLALENGWAMEWRSLGVLDPFLARGVDVTVSRQSKLQVKVEAQ